MKALKSGILALGLLVTLTACGKVGKSAEAVASASLDVVGCKVSQSEMWSALHRVVESGDTYPSAEELREALVAYGEKKSLGGTAFEKYVDAFVANYAVTIGEIQSKLAPQDAATWKKALAEAEVGVRVTEAHAELQDKVQASLSKLEAAEKELNATCGVADVPDSSSDGRAPAGEIHPALPAFNTVWEQLKATESPEIYGSRKTIATAYQSCDVVALPPMNVNTPATEGIEILPGKNPVNGGLLRKYKSLALINSTHHYIKNNRVGNGSGCFEVRNAPMIYDFGGKPYASASNEKLLDFFRDGGTGTDVLGIDCSAFVFSSLAIAGLKMDPDPKKVLKSTLVTGIGSRAFKEPQANGLRCLEKITVTKAVSLLPGDVVAINGHVVMIDSIGDDPFGLADIKRVEDCNSANIKSSKFDFVISQSSPSKGSTGINRFEARDYVATSATYATGFLRYATAACRAKFGAAPNLNSPDLSVVRHKKTAECRATPLELARESCINACRPI